MPTLPSSILITVVIILLILFIGLIFWTQNKRSRISPQELKKFQNHWQGILKEIKSSPKNAVLEADKLLDQALKLKNYTGSLGEKMKKAGPLFSDRNGVWGAHKLRNRIAHELNIKVSDFEAKKALGQFKTALRDLGIKL
ncbi:hypothetical protein HN748_04760 [Candidatus Peregrinibacteria bacterium]|jgi:hypothetical protein|nr:hypothetical protein [Candidatus Peregrinibacteria bacterium]MBT7484159.1 hypothetical protein [Candidatus Peregrinibacteria bacterium]MBT7703521.1 hypothetical protein [Candidatus Peregrinibacteria bacterium]